jgi:hypothetical protein
MSRWAPVVLPLLLCGCTTAYRYVTIPPHLIPLQSELPRVYAAELECLADETYLRMVERERALRYELEQYRTLVGKPGLPGSRPEVLP